MTSKTTPVTEPAFRPEIEGRQERFQMQCLYSITWQLKRMEFSWSSDQDILTSCARIRAYCAVENPMSTWRALNLINAVLLGRVGRHESVTDFGVEKVLTLQKDLQEQHKRLWPPFIRTKPTWFWEVEAGEIQGVDATLPELRRLATDLRGRVKTALRRHGHSRNRPELTRFLGLLESEIERRGIPRTESAV